LDALSKSHPYNPLWAQLGELYGALGFPMKIAKTVVTSGAKKLELLNRILRSLTYFIRCSEVEKQVIERQDSTEELNATTSWQSCKTSRTALFNEDSQPSHSSFTRNFLSSHDVVTVFDSRVDHGVEIGRELQVENGMCPFLDKCNDNMGTESSPVPSKVTKDYCNLEQNALGLEEHDCSCEQKSVSVGQLSDRSESIRDLRKGVHSLVPQVSGMRRTASFMKRLDGAAAITELEHSDPKSSTGTDRLYPSLADLKLVDDETGDSSFSLHPEDKSSVAADLEVIEVDNVNTDFSFHQEMSQKVSRLCRVPTSAILYHLQNVDNGKENKVEEMILPKRVESERQRSSVETPMFKAKVNEVPEMSKSPLSSSCTVSREKISVRPINEVGESRAGKGDVIFVIGDNEQLVDLKQSHKPESDNNKNAIPKDKESLGHDICDDCTSVLCTSSQHNSHAVVSEDGKSCEHASQASHSGITVSCVAGDVKSSACEHEFDSEEKFKINMNVGVRTCKFQEEAVNVPTKEQRTKQCTTCSTSKNGYRVVTVRPSVIELEDECGGLKTDLSASDSVRTSRPVSRSHSLLSPLSGRKVGNSALSCRRHSDCICEISRYLKDYHSVRFHFERCEGLLMNYIEGRDQKKCSHQTDKKMDKIAEARGNFCFTENSMMSEEYISRSKDTSNVGCITPMDKSASNKPSECFDASVIRKEKHSECMSGYVNEGNAVFEDYSNVSDDSVLFGMKISSDKAEEDGKTPTGQHQCESVLELPMPRLV
jgi:hypothetical protein